MAAFFNPTPEERRKLEQIAGGIPGVQDTLVRNHPQLSVRDRVFCESCSTHAVRVRFSPVPDRQTGEQE